MRRLMLTAIGVCVLMIGSALPAAASPPENATEVHHITRHRAAAQFNNPDGDGWIQIYATWYSPNSSSGDNWFTPESNLYVSYWGDWIGDNCTVPSTRIDEWDMKWSQNHGYVSFDSECGFIELYVQGDRGVEPDHEWSHYNEYWLGTHSVRSQQWNDIGTTAQLFLDGQQLNVVNDGAGLIRTTVTLIR